MNCAEREPELALYVSEDLDADAAVSLRRHLGGCDVCRARLEEYRANLAWLRGQRLGLGRSPARDRGPELAAELQRRLSAAIATRTPARWPLTWLQKLQGALPRLRHETIVAGLAATLLMIGAVGALQRPLPLPAGPARTADPSVALARGGVSLLGAELPPDPGFAAESAFERASEEPALEESESDGGEEGATEAMSHEEPARGNDLRIELATRDPDVRIIWFAEARAR